VFSSCSLVRLPIAIGSSVVRGIDPVDHVTGERSATALVRRRRQR
jgi:hypothetical protein